MAFILERNHLVVSKVVFVFDICSSSNILEDLIRTDSMKKWVNLLSGLKNFLGEQSELYGFEIYKFVGDGWILLFEPDIRGPKLFEFTRLLCNRFSQNLYPKVEGLLETPPDLVGLTIGMDKGSLIKVKFQDKVEYIGRPLNIASRLQSAVKEKDSKPNNKCLISKPLYYSIKRSLEGSAFHLKEVTRQLRNIADGKDYKCFKMDLSKVPDNEPKPRKLLRKLRYSDA